MRQSQDMYQSDIITRSENAVAIAVKEVNGSLIYYIPMDRERALNMRYWLAGLEGSHKPFDFSIGNRNYWLPRDIWYPMLKSLNVWHESNHVVV